MGEGEPRFEPAGVILDTGYYQGKVVNIVRETRVDGVVLIKVTLGEKDKKYPGIPVEIYSCKDEGGIPDILNKIRKGKYWEEMN